MNLDRLRTIPFVVYGALFLGAWLGDAHAPVFDMPGPVLGPWHQPQWAVPAVLWIGVVFWLFLLARPFSRSARLLWGAGAILGFALKTKTYAFGLENHLGFLKGIVLWALMSMLPLMAAVAPRRSSQQPSWISVIMASAFGWVLIFNLLPMTGLFSRAFSAVSALNIGSQYAPLGASLVARLILFIAFLFAALLIARFVVADWRQQNAQPAAPAVVGASAVTILASLLLFDLLFGYALIRGTIDMGGWIYMLFPFVIFGFGVLMLALFVTWCLMPVLLSAVTGARLGKVDFGPLQGWAQSWFPNLFTEMERDGSSSPNNAPVAPVTDSTQSFGRRK